MGIAHAVALKSKDPSTQVGCVIVDAKHRPVSFGFNGFPAGCDEEVYTYDRPLKYNLILHAEMNAILFASKPLDGCTLYSTHYCCDNCLKHIIQAGIKHVYFDDSSVRERFDDHQVDAIVTMLNGNDITLQQLSAKYMPTLRDMH